MDCIVHGVAKSLMTEHISISLFFIMGRSQWLTK